MDRKSKELLWEGLAVVIAALSAWLLTKGSKPKKGRSRSSGTT
jgi:hypothetical protein